MYKFSKSAFLVTESGKSSPHFWIDEVAQLWSETSFSLEGFSSWERCPLLRIASVNKTIKFQEYYRWKCCRIKFPLTFLESEFCDTLFFVSRASPRHFLSNDLCTFLTTFVDLNRFFQIEGSLMMKWTELLSSQELCEKTNLTLRS